MCGPANTGPPPGAVSFMSNWVAGTGVCGIGFNPSATQSAPGDGTPRFLQCCNMLGHCFMEKGMPRPAALWFKRGLEAPGHTEDEYQAMRYDLGTAYEQMGENGRAIEVLSEVYAIDVSYRGVAERLRELQRTVNREQ